MDFSMLSFLASGDPASSIPARDKLSSVIASTASLSDVKLYSEQKELLVGLSEAFEKSDVIILTPEPSVFVETKHLVLRALRLRSVISPQINEKINTSDNDIRTNARLITAQSAVPKDSVLFLSPDGLNSGFAVVNGKQHFIVVPLDEALIEHMIGNGLQKYLSALAESAPTTDSEEITAKNQELLSSTYDLQFEKNLKVVIAADQLLPVFGNYLDNHPSISSYIVKKTNENEPVNKLPLKQYIASFSKTAMLDSGSDIAVAVSNIYSTKDNADRFIVYLAICNSSEAILKKIYSKNGQSPKDFADMVLAETFRSLKEYIQNDQHALEGFSVIPFIQDVTNASGFYRNISNPRKRKRTMTAILVVISVITFIICMTLAFFLEDIQSYTKDIFGSKFFANIFPAYTHTAVDTKIHVIKDFGTSFFQSSGAQISELASETNSSLPSSGTSNESTTKFHNVNKTRKNEVKPHAPTGVTVVNGVIIDNTPNDYPEPPPIKTTEPKTTATTKPETKKTETESSEKTSYFTSLLTFPTVYTTSADTTASAGTSENEQLSDSYIFKVKGFGHGVGMSQEGALEMSRQGKTYRQILTHYYPSTALKTDISVPDYCTVAGEKTPMKEFLSLAVRAEIGPGSTETTEAIKAQIVATYSYAKSSKFNVSLDYHGYAVTTTELIKKAVDELYGVYVSYNNSTAETLYFASSSGYTTSSVSVWGGDIPYLRGGVSSPEKVSNSTYTIDEATLKDRIQKYKYASITLPSDPSKWLKIIEKDKGGYVTKIQVGNVVMNGNTFRNKIIPELRSHCFTLEYINYTNLY